MKKCGFTLIELLIVIAVIGMLVSILVPVLRAVKNHARSVQCGNNLRQLSFGFMIYHEETGAFPYGFWDVDLINPPFWPEGGYAGQATHDRSGLWWFNYLQQTMEFDLKQDSIIWCPARNFTGPASTNNILCGNYGVNRSVFRDARQSVGCQFFGDPLRMTQIRTPSSTLLITDSGYSLVSWLAAVEATTPVFENSNRIAAFYIPGMEINQNRPELVNQRDAIIGRHPHQTLNVGFADGHTEVRNADSLAIDSNSANNGHIPSLWQP